jgi:hypothetical protein
MLPHYQKASRAVFVTFCKGNREPFSSEAKDLVLQHCLHDDGKRYHLHAAVIMPEHVHLLLTPMCDDQGWVYGLRAILKLIKGVPSPALLFPGPFVSKNYRLGLGEGQKSLGQECPSHTDIVYRKLFPLFTLLILAPRGS